MTKTSVFVKLLDESVLCWRPVDEIEATPDYGYGEFSVAVTHVYHHLNTAWNSKTESQARVAACEEADFFLWRQFPKDIELGA